MQPPALPGDMFLLQPCWLVDSIVIPRAEDRAEGDSPILRRARGLSRISCPHEIGTVPLDIGTEWFTAT